jgi:uncharacterized protein YecE (DUF72 family)
MDLRAGTSGFAYKEWKGAFYPPDLASDRLLAFYGGELPAVEINNTFYRLPKEGVLARWEAEVPDGFRFAVKASQKITHYKRLKDAGPETGYLLSVLGALGAKLGAVLFQLPPNLKVDLPRLEAFLDTLPPGLPAAFEFRHPSWDDDSVLDLLGARAYALVAADTDEQPWEEDLPGTAPWGYLRLRRESYDDAALRAWHRRIAATGWREAFVFFKHEDEAAGPRMAKRFLELAG